MSLRWKCLCNDAKIEEKSLKKEASIPALLFFHIFLYGINIISNMVGEDGTSICNYSSSFGSVRKKERKNGIVTAADKISAIDCEISMPNRPKLCDRIRMTGTKIIPLLVQARKNARPLLPIL